MNIGDLLRLGTERLGAAGVDSPQVDAEILLATLVGVQRAQLPTQFTHHVGEDTAADYTQMLMRREAREPLQHIIGEAPFRYISVAVGPGVFIPRPETELLIDLVMPALRRFEHPVVVDLCSGSGALALAIENELPKATVIAVESDPAALAWLRRNVDDGAVQVLDGDVTDPAMVRAEGSVDVVVCNPPYVPETASVATEVRADPPVAVFAGADGLALMPSVIARAAELLRPGGTFAVEHDDTHGEAVPALLRQDGRWSDIAEHADLTGRPRFAVAVRR